MTESIKKKYITDDKGLKTAVILNIKDYRQLIEEIDDLYCALGYDQAKVKNKEDIVSGNYITLKEFIDKKKTPKSKRKVKI